MAIRPARIPGLPEGVEVRRSDRRRRSVAAFREGGITVVVVPARMSVAEAAKHANALHARLLKRSARAAVSDEDLAKRAGLLSKRYLPGSPLPTSIRWSTTQNRRWGSCTSADGTIRLSHRLRGMPAYVIDYVLLHELTHLLEANHGPEFNRLLEAYPDRARACSFLDGVEFANAHE